MEVHGNHKERIMGRPLRLAGLLALSVITPFLSGAEQPRTSNEQDPIAAIERLGGAIRRDGNQRDHPVEEVVLVGPDIVDSNLGLLRTVPKLRILDLTNTAITDTGLQRLETLSRLERLNLTFTSVTGSGVTHLKHLPALEELVLFGCPCITDSALNQVKDIPTLRYLDLSHTKVTAKGLTKLTALTKLQRLSVMGIQIREAEMMALKRGMPKVTIERGTRNTADKRLRKHFGIPIDQELSPATIRASILLRLPLSSSDEKVCAFLKSAGIGEDKFSSYQSMEDDPGIICRIKYDPESGDLVHLHYGILFYIESGKGLKEIEVRQWLTGP